MVKLENISTLDICGLNNRSEDISRKNFKLMQEKKIKDYEQLKQLLIAQKRLASQGKSTDMCLFDGLEKRIFDKEKEIVPNNEPHIYVPEDSFMITKSFDSDEIDKNTSGRDLLYGTPVPYAYHRDSLNGTKARFFDVYQIKQLLSHCNPDGTNSFNSLVFADATENLHEREIYLMLDALKKYEMQLLRQYEENESTLTDENISRLMYLNKEEKLKLIRKQYQEIADYLCSFDSFVWGADSKYDDIDLIWKSAHKHDLKNVDNRNKFMNIISDYVTLEEAEQGLVKTRALDRFGTRRK